MHGLFIIHVILLISVVFLHGNVITLPHLSCVVLFFDKVCLKNELFLFTCNTAATEVQQALDAAVSAVLRDFGGKFSMKTEEKVVLTTPTKFVLLNL